MIRELITDIRSIEIRIHWPLTLGIWGVWAVMKAGGMI